MLEIEFTSKMKRDVKRMQKRGKDMSKLGEVLKSLVSHQVLPLQFEYGAVNWTLGPLRLDICDATRWTLASLKLDGERICSYF